MASVSTAGPLDSGPLPQVGWGQFQGELELQHPSTVLPQPLSAHFRFR